MPKDQGGWGIWGSEMETTKQSHTCSVKFSDDSCSITQSNSSSIKCTNGSANFRADFLAYNSCSITQSNCSSIKCTDSSANFRTDFRAYNSCSVTQSNGSSIKCTDGTANFGADFLAYNSCSFIKSNTWADYHAYNSSI